MKILAVSTEGPTLDDMVDPRFGRAAGFIIANTDDEQFRYVDNGASQIMPQGAGIETAQRLANEGVHIVLSGFVGPKAFEALRAAGMEVCQNVQDMTVGEALKQYRAGKFPFASSSNK